MVHKPLLRAGTVLLLAAGALLLAVTVRAGVWGYRAYFQRRETAVCVRAVMEDTLILSGLVLRQERLLLPAGTFSVWLPDPGERLPAGESVAIVYETAGDYFRGALLRRTRRALVRELRGAVLSPCEASRALAAASARGDFSAASAAAGELRLALRGPDEDTADRLRAEIAAMEAAGADEFLFLSPASGFFYPDADGWETLSFAGAEELSPRELRFRLAHPPEPRGEARLVTGGVWRFLALAEQEDADRLAPGDELELILPGEGARCAARVESLRSGEGDGVIVTFSSEARLSDVASLRQVTLTAVLEHWEGLRLPAAAVREADGKRYVLRAAWPESVPAEVTVLARQGGDVLIAETLPPGTEVLLP